MTTWHHANFSNRSPLSGLRSPETTNSSWIHFPNKSSTRSSITSRLPASVPLLLLRKSGGKEANNAPSMKSGSPVNPWWTASTQAPGVTRAESQDLILYPIRRFSRHHRMQGSRAFQPHSQESQLIDTSSMSNTETPDKVSRVESSVTVLPLSIRYRLPYPWPP